MQSDAVYIAAARRTPMGAFMGQLADTPAPEMGARAIAALLESTGLDPARIDEVLMGCVLEANLGQAPARQAALAAGVPQSVPCTTVNKVCGSGMKTLMLAYDSIRAGSASVVVAGGMESMSRSPHLLATGRSGQKFGHQQLLDHMLRDGLENAYDGRAMGEFAEDLVQQLGISREAQDRYAAESTRRARAAAESGAFDAELAPMTVTADQLPAAPNLERMAKLPPAFRANGTVTAANASSIADGAAALLLASASQTKTLGLPRLARIVAHASHAQAPEEFTRAPIGVISRLLEKTGWYHNEVDLYEINEAFAAVVLAAEGELSLDHARVNVNGGACALGHPIGASGARIVVTLVHALRQRGLRRGIAALCIGGGEATAVAVEIDEE